MIWLRWLTTGNWVTEGAKFGKRQVESAVDRQQHESCEKNPGTVHTMVYVWEKTQSSGGLELYKCVKVNKKENKDIFTFYRSHQRVFNAFSNEWDFCEEFCFGPVDDSYNSDSGSEYGNDDNYAGPGYSMDFVSQSTYSSPPMDVESSSTTWVGHHFSRDPIKTMSLIYGYILHNHFSALVSNKQADNLVNNTFTTLSDLFPFKLISCPFTNLFVFSSPWSNACKWVLGIKFPFSALYICWYILKNPQAHTILTVANCLLDQGIPFRTLLPLPCSTWQTTFTKVYMLRTYRLDNHEFTKADFDVAMLAYWAILISPQGWAAFLQGGILGCIAKEYLSKDGVLDGPSIEITTHQVDYLGPSESNDRGLYLAPHILGGLHWSPGQFGGVQVESRYNLFWW